LVDELHALRGRDAVGLEEDVHLAQGLLLLPGGLDGGGADLADALDLAELAGLLAEDAEGVGAEGVDDLVGVDFADARHEAAAEVFADAVDGGGELGLVRDDLELRAVLRVPRPFTRQQEGLAALHARQCADDGHAVLGGLGGLGAQLGDGVVVLLVEEDDALKDAGQGGGSGGGHGGPTDAHRCAGRQYRRNRLRGKSGHIGVMRYFDDLQAGDKFNTAEYEMTAEEIIAFGRKFDPQAFHTDPVAAKGTLFGQLVASGWHTAAVSMQLDGARGDGARWRCHRAGDGVAALAAARAARRPAAGGDGDRGTAPGTGPARPRFGQAPLPHLQPKRQGGAGHDGHAAGGEATGLIAALPWQCGAG
jgi:hypothetical protein